MDEGGSAARVITILLDENDVVSVYADNISAWSICPILQAIIDEAEVHGSPDVFILRPALTNLELEED